MGPKYAAIHASFMDLPRPGLIGLAIRFTFGLAVLFMGYGAIVDRASFWDGYTNPAGALGYIIPIGFVTSWVINELTTKRWGQKPLLVVLLGMAVAIGIGAFQGDAFGSIFGIYLWAWVMAFAALLGPALLLAVALRTPGCEMRSYAHFIAKLRGKDVNAAVCPGWIDRFDAIRIGGRL